MADFEEQALLSLAVQTQVYEIAAHLVEKGAVPDETLCFFGREEVDDLLHNVPLLQRAQILPVRWEGRPDISKALHISLLQPRFFRWILEIPAHLAQSRRQLLADVRVSVKEVADDDVCANV